MSTADRVYVGDVGTAIILDCGADVSAATARSIEARKPDGSTVTWAAVASGTNSIRHDVLPGALDQPGTWVLQAKVTLPAGTWRGRSVPLRVHAVYA